MDSLVYCVITCNYHILRHAQTVFLIFMYNAYSHIISTANDSVRLFTSAINDIICHLCRFIIPETSVKADKVRIILYAMLFKGTLIARKPFTSGGSLQRTAQKKYLPASMDLDKMFCQLHKRYFVTGINTFIVLIASIYKNHRNMTFLIYIPAYFVKKPRHFQRICQNDNAIELIIIYSVIYLHFSNRHCF